MKFAIKFGTVKSGWSIAYIKGSQVILFKTYRISSPKIDFGLANSANLHGMQYYSACNLGYTMFAIVPA